MTSSDSAASGGPKNWRNRLPMVWLLAVRLPVVWRLVVWLLVVWILSAGYMARDLKRGWVPHDEGSIGESAERVLHGELPHRDFDEIYTGGLTFMHALAFRAMGINLATPRYVLFGFFLLWVPAVFYVATRLTPAYAAGAITLLCAAWSVPNYAAALPSWYNLFFATFGVAALLRFIEVGTRRWLVIAGICGGLSILAKIAGLYFVAAGLLFFVFREQNLAREPGAEATPRERGKLYAATVAIGLALFAALLLSVLRNTPGKVEFVFFGLPGVALTILLLVREFAEMRGPSRPRKTDRQRFAALLGMGAWFLAGVAIPIAAFLIPYLTSGSLTAVVKGVFVLSARRFAFAARPLGVPPGVAISLVILAAFAVLVVKALPPKASGAILACVLGGALFLSLKSPLIYEIAWFSFALSIPVLVAWGATMLAGTAARTRLPTMRQEQVMLLLCVAALTSLVQVPFSHPIYFCYVAPFAILAATAVFISLKQPPRLVLGALVVFFLVYAVWQVTPGFINEMGVEYTPDVQTGRLTLARAGGLRVYADEAQTYDELIPVIQSHAGGGEFMYAGPDCPQLYFLSGLKNPTRTLFDFLDDSSGRTERILRDIDSHGVNVVGIYDHPQFSGALAADLQRALEERFPNSVRVGHFEVRWRKK